jgi:hypothetical protein
MASELGPATNLVFFGRKGYAEMMDKQNQLYPNDPEKAYRENLNVVSHVAELERRSSPGGSNVGKFSKGLREKAEADRKTSTGQSLMTDKNRTTRKRIYGMGKTTGQNSSGAVKKPKLGGE